MHQKPGGKKLLFYKIYFEPLLSFFIITFLWNLGGKIGIIPVFKFPWLLVSTCLTF